MQAAAPCSSHPDGLCAGRDSLLHTGRSRGSDASGLTAGHDTAGRPGWAGGPEGVPAGSALHGDADSGARSTAVNCS